MLPTIIGKIPNSPISGDHEVPKIKSENPILAIVGMALTNKNTQIIPTAKTHNSAHKPNTIDIQNSRYALFVCGSLR